MTTPEDLQARAGEAAALMKAMSNPHRLLILCMLCDAQRIHYFITHPAVQQVINTLKTLYCP